MIALNVAALTRLTYAVAPQFVERDKGTIVNIASIVAMTPEVLNGVYGGSKAFVLAFSQTLHHELAAKGVRVQAVLPGATRYRLLGRRGLAGRAPAAKHRHACGRSRRCGACRPRSGRAGHRPVAARRGAVERIRIGTQCARAQPFAQQAGGTLWRASGRVNGLTQTPA